MGSKLRHAGQHSLESENGESCEARETLLLCEIILVARVRLDTKIRGHKKYFGGNALLNQHLVC